MQEFSYSHKYFGTSAVVSLVMESESLAEQISAEAFAIFALYESQFSRFLSTSELSKLNTERELIVSDEFIHIIKRSHDLYLVTYGAFNPLVQVARFGYDVDFSKLDNSKQEIKMDKYDSDFNKIVYNLETKKVSLAEGQQLDFGGILKGYIAEKVAKKIQEKYKECQGIIVNLGGDLHTRGVDEEGEPFIFMIYNPISDVQIPVAFTDTSLATSGTYKRKWETPSGQRHHILTGEGDDNPSSKIVSASVIHQDGMTTEALAKMLLINGKEKLLREDKQINYQYVIITQKGETLTNII